MIAKVERMKINPTFLISENAIVLVWDFNEKKKIQKVKVWSIKIIMYFPGCKKCLHPRSWSI